jgi:PadR family transcriptional regulator AphA
LSRPLTYRSIDLLVERRLVSRRGTAQGRGGDRTLLRITAAGRRALTEWFEVPVEHLRDVRTELLLKLVLRDRAGLSNRPLLETQRAHFADAIEALTSDRGDLDVVARWRMESARAVARFLDGALGERP